MALSDYAQMVIDKNGQSVTGRIALPNGKAVQFYKNWLYLYDSPDAEYCCGSVTGTSHIEWHGTTIETYATKNQHGLMGVVSHGWDDNKVAYAGIAVSAYPKGLWHDLFGGIKDYCGIGLRVAREFNRLFRKRRWKPIIFHTSRDFFGTIWFVPSVRLWREYAMPYDEFRTVDFTKVRYFNPGDLYFVDNVDGAEQPQGTLPGEAATPIFHRLIERMIRG